MQLKVADIPGTERLTAKQARTLIARAAKPSKYRAKKVNVDGHCFDSKAEAKKWSQLVTMQQAGVITDLRRQVRFPMLIDGKLVCTYVADFTYTADNGRKVVIDVKGYRTQIYRLKKKLFEALHPGLQITEV